MAHQPSPASALDTLVSGALSAPSGYVFTANGDNQAPTWQLATGSGGAVQLVPTAVKTSSYSSSAGDLVLCDISSTSFPVTLPTAPADKSTVAVKVVKAATGKTLTISTGGSDVFDAASGATSRQLTLGITQGSVFQYQATGAIWQEIANETPPSTHDLQLAARGFITETGDPQTYTQGDAPPTGNIFGYLMGFRAGQIVTGLALQNSTAAAGTLPTTVRAGLADATGKILVLSGNVNSLASWNIGLVLFPFTAAYTIPATGGYFGSFIVNGAWGTTQPTPVRGQSTNASGAALSGFPGNAFNQGSQTDLPAINSSMTISGGGGRGYWMGAY